MSEPTGKLDQEDISGTESVDNSHKSVPNETVEEDCERDQEHLKPLEDHVEKNLVDDQAVEKFTHLFSVAGAGALERTVEIFVKTGTGPEFDLKSYNPASVVKYQDSSIEQKAKAAKEEAMTDEICAKAAKEQAKRSQEFLKKALKTAKLANMQATFAREQINWAEAYSNDILGQLKQKILSIDFDQLFFSAKKHFKSNDGTCVKDTVKPSLLSELLKDFPGDQEQFRDKMMEYAAKKLVNTLEKHSAVPDKVSASSDVLDGCSKDDGYFRNKMIVYVSNKLVSIADTQSFAADRLDILAEMQKVQSLKIAVAANIQLDAADKQGDASSRQSAAAEKMILAADKVKSNWVKRFPLKIDTGNYDVISLPLCQGSVTSVNTQDPDNDLSVALETQTLEDDVETKNVNYRKESGAEVVETNAVCEKVDPDISDEPNSLELEVKRAFEEFTAAKEVMVNAGKDIAVAEEEVAKAEKDIFSSRNEMADIKVKIAKVKLIMAETKEEMARIRKRLGTFYLAMAEAKLKFAEAREAIVIVKEKKAEVRLYMANVKLEISKTNAEIMTKNKKTGNSANGISTTSKMTVKLTEEQSAATDKKVSEVKSSLIDLGGKVECDEKSVQAMGEVSEEKEIVEANVKMAAAKEELNEATEELAEVREEITDVWEERDDAIEELFEAGEQMNEARGIVALAKEEFVEVNEEMAELKELADVEKARMEMAKSKEDSAKAGEDITRANAETAKAKEEILKAKKVMTSAKEDTAKARQNCLSKIGEDRPTKKSLKPLITKIHDLKGWAEPE